MAAAKRHGGVDKYANHMFTRYNKWTHEMMQAEANKYPTRIAWQKGSPNSYNAVYKKYGNIDRYAGHMIGNIRWAPKLIQAEANKYMTLIGWQKGSRKSYQAARIKGGIDKYVGHMIIKHKPKV